MLLLKPSWVSSWLKGPWLKCHLSSRLKNISTPDFSNMNLKLGVEKSEIEMFFNPKTDVIWLLNLKEFMPKWCPAEQYCRIAQRMLENLKGSHFIEAQSSKQVKVSSHSAPAEHSKWKCVKIGATWAFRCTLLEVSSGRLRFREQLTYLLPFHHDVSSLL